MSRRSARGRHETRARVHSLYRRLAGASAVVLGTLGLATATAVSVSTPAATADSPGTAPSYTSTDDLGIQPGLIKHVWLIILENKSYDASFTGLNNNTYLWKTLPNQGVLLKNYYATGHSSQDNYTSMVSGQAPQPDLQGDCSYYDDMAGDTTDFPSSSGVNLSGTVLYTTGPNAGQINWPATYQANPNYGQWTATVGAEDFANVANYGCVYPSNVETLFNQFDAAGVSWKGYAQDLAVNNFSSTNGTTSTSDTVTSNSNVSNLTLAEDACGAPYIGSTESASSPSYPVAAPFPTSTQTSASANPGSANTSGAYVPKHFPFPWFRSLINNSGDCNPAHIGTMFDDPTTESAGQNVGDFYSDLQADESQPDSYPNFVWMTPNNCSDAHDASCDNNGSYTTPTAQCTDPVTGGGCSEGGNLSGGWDAADIPAAPTSSNGGNGAGQLYATDQYLKHIIPEIESSNEYKDGGLIDITFDEGYPAFTYQNSYYNDSPSNYTSPTIPAAYTRNGATTDGLGAQVGLSIGAAGQTIDPNETGGNGCPSVPNTSVDPGFLASIVLSNGQCQENFEPTGPSTPIVEGTGTLAGEQLSPGPGANQQIHRADNCNNSTSLGTIPWTQTTCVLGAASTGASAASATTFAGNYASGTYWIPDNAIKITDEGRAITGAGIPAGTYVGTVIDGPNGSCTAPSGLTGPTCNPTSFNPSGIPNGGNGSTGFEENGWFELVNSATCALQGNCSTANAVATTAASSGNDSLAGFCDPTPTAWGGAGAGCTNGAANDPYYDGTTPQYGGGDTGSVLISPYIDPGTSSTVYYNHYSWLRTMEDLFAVGSASGGLDGLGHLGYAAQPGLVPFGHDVFNNAPGWGMVVSELRIGTSGNNYVELTNQSGQTINLNGWTLQVALSNGQTQSVDLSSVGTVSANHHVLISDQASVDGVASDVQMNLSGATPVGVQLDEPASQANAIADAVGLSSAPAGFSLGTPLSAPASTPTGEYAWVRNFADGQQDNSENNAADFTLVATDGSGGGALGAPAPADNTSPVVHNDILQSSVPANAVTEPSIGTIDISRVVTNCSGQPTTGVCAFAPANTAPLTATKLQFRITGLGATQGGVAIPFAAAQSGNSNLTVEAPSVSSNAGLNAELLATPDLPQGGLAPGASVTVTFEFHFTPQSSQNVDYEFSYNTEDDLEAVTSSTGTGSTPSTPPSVTPVEPVVTGTVTSSGATGSSPAVSSAGASPAVTATVAPAQLPAVKAVTKRAKPHKVKKHKRSKRGRHGRRSRHGHDRHSR